MEKFKEKKIVILLELISVYIFLASLLSLVLTFVNIIFLGGFLIGVLITGVFIIISSSLSDKEKYTDDFLNYMRSLLKEAKTLEELKDIETIFISLAIKDIQYH